VDDANTWERLRDARVTGPVQWADVPWNRVQPILRKRLGVTVLPAVDSDEAAHFERLNLVANGGSNWELLQAISVATGTRVMVERRRVRFARPRG
jgi:hypothetical protein